MKNNIFISTGVVLLAVCSVYAAFTAHSGQSRSELANMDFVELLYNTSNQLLIEAKLEEAKLASFGFYLDWGVKFQLAILEPIVAELHDRLAAKSILQRDYVDNLQEQLIFVETSIGEQFLIFKEVNNPKFSPKTENQTAKTQALLVQAQNILRKYPNSREIPSVKNEIHKLSEYVEKSAHNDLDRVLARVEKSLDLLEEKASYRLPIQFEVFKPKTVPENLNISFFGVLSKMAISHDHLSKLYHSKLDKYISTNHSRLIGAFKQELSLFDNLVSHLKHQLSNSSQYFPPTYVRVIEEENLRVTHQIDKQDEIVELVIQKGNAEPNRTVTEIHGKAKLLQRLALGMIQQHSNLIEASAFRSEILGLSILIVESSRSQVTESELFKFGQALDRHQATIEYLTASSNWNMIHSGGYL